MQGKIVKLSVKSLRRQITSVPEVEKQHYCTTREVSRIDHQMHDIP